MMKDNLDKMALSKNDVLLIKDLVRSKLINKVEEDSNSSNLSSLDNLSNVEVVDILSPTLTIIYRNERGKEDDSQVGIYNIYDSVDLDEIAERYSDLVYLAFSRYFDKSEYVGVSVHIDELSYQFDNIGGWLTGRVIFIGSRII